MPQSELLDRFTRPTDLASDAPVVSGESSEVLRDVIGFCNASFTWDRDDEESSSRRRKFTLRIKDELFFRRGQFNLIVGPTGSGKTSMLLALLGMLIISFRLSVNLS